MLSFTSSAGRLRLELGDLLAHDPGAPERWPERRFLCLLPACANHQRYDRHRTLVVSLENGLWICHRCQARGRLREYKPTEAGRGSSAVVRRAFDLTLPDHPLREVERIKIDDARRRYAAARVLAETPGSAYLTARGICDRIPEPAQVRFTADFFGRPAVLFPVRDREGELVAVSGRYVDVRSDPKTRVAGRKKLGVFATPAAFDAEPLVICEAPIDALSLATCGVPAIALGGTDGPDWLARACAFRRVALALDADDAGDAGSAMWARNCWPFGARVERWRPSGAKDWNELLVTLGAQRLRAIVRLKAEIGCACGEEIS